jgi:uncharacterized SAM-binding protein YcdF (DUF218 family)
MGEKRVFDALLVLGGEHPEHRARCRAALRAYAQCRASGHAPPMLIASSGVVVSHRGRRASEATLMAEFLTAGGAPAHDVLVETRALDTLGNVVLGGDLALQHGCRRIAIVTDDFHIWRSSLLFERVYGTPPVAAIGTGIAGTWFERAREVASYCRIAAVLAVARVPRHDPARHRIFLRKGLAA